MSAEPENREACSERAAPPSVVTLGGGHGQAALLSALMRLRCRITAVVSVADDGGCSGRLREEFGMPPPGDVRRCLSTLARNRTLAERFEERIAEGDDSLLRSAGNLALLEAYVRHGSLQRAADWAAELLECVGRVVPVAEAPARLAAYDRAVGLVEGETNITQRSAAPMVAAAHGPEGANPCAQSAIEAADLLLIGPGSFVTSVLATVTTAAIAGSIVASRATRVLVHNLQAERDEPLSLETHVRLLRDHLVINSGDDEFELLALEHLESAHPAERRLADGTRVLGSRLASDHDGGLHDAGCLAEALQHHFGLERRIPSHAAPERLSATDEFEEHLARARSRLALVGARVAAG